MANGERTEHDPKRRVDRAGCAARSLASSGNIKLTEVDGETGKKIGLLRKMKENREYKKTEKTENMHENPAVREPINFSEAMNPPSQRIPRPTSADDSSYQTPEGTDGHYGDNFQPKRKGTGNILVDPIGNQWSNSTDPKDWM